MSQGGNKSKYWNEAVVAAACTKLSEAGITPTVNSVRSHLAIEKGSDATVQRYIRLWRENRINDDSEADTPEPLLTALNSLWHQALEVANKQLESDRELLAKDQKAFIAEAVALEASLNDAEQTARNALAEAEEIRHSEMELKSLLETQTGMLTKAKQQMNEQALEIKSLSTQLATEKEKSQILNAQLEQQAKTATQVQNMFRHDYEKKLEFIKQELGTHLDKKEFAAIFNSELFK
ncbi:DNA-binding protein [Neptuniibacter halophilus]|uniref:DNA-binding protein n=1 Tax=Neptuniibacter halophilus TaxID=651666 RepID=UPI0025733F08|nr:DNA-binding protein [Neptuniibacter halophilus]